MKHFTSKTVEDAVQAASKAVGIPAEQLIYKVIEEKKGLFGIGKEATIEIYDIDDAAAFAEEYLKTALGGMGVEAETSSNIDEDIIHVNINSERNPILIGKGGRTLQALNELARLAVSNKFRGLIGFISRRSQQLISGIETEVNCPFTCLFHSTECICSCIVILFTRGF